MNWRVHIFPLFIRSSLSPLLSASACIGLLLGKCPSLPANLTKSLSLFQNFSEKPSKIWSSSLHFNLSKTKSVHNLIWIFFNWMYEIKVQPFMLSVTIKQYETIWNQTLVDHILILNFMIRPIFSVVYVIIILLLKQNKTMSKLYKKYNNIFQKFSLLCLYKERWCHRPEGRPHWV